MNFIIAILFNTKWSNLGNNTDEKWLRYRLIIFERYTLSSLKQQSDSHFIVWMICAEESKTILKHILLEKEYKNVRFIFGEKELQNEMEKYSCPNIVLKIDSDDCYHKETIGITRGYLQQSKSISMVMFNNGYIYDSITKEIFEFVRFSLPNYATVFPQKEDWNLENFKKYCWCDLTKVRRQFNPIIDKNNRVLLINHQMNLSKDPRRNNQFEINGRTGKGKEVEINLGDYFNES